MLIRSHAKGICLVLYQLTNCDCFSNMQMKYCKYYKCPCIEYRLKSLKCVSFNGRMMGALCVLQTLALFCEYTPFTLVVNTSRSFPHSRLITGFVNRLTRRVTLVKQELITIPEHLSSPPVFSGVRVTRSLVLYVYFVDRCLSICTFSFGHCVVCSSSIYGF